jgi:hypothetical protein
MSTDRRIRASRLNGAESRGPVTIEGRLKSSANSARHHLLSKTILLENERPEAFADLLAGLTREFNPETEAQRALVETMAVSRWRQMRIWAVERATLATAMEAYDPQSTDPATRAALAFRSLADDSRTLDLLNRYETRFERQFARSLNLLMKLADPENPLNQSCQTNGDYVLDYEFYFMHTTNRWTAKLTALDQASYRPQRTSRVKRRAMTTLRPRDGLKACAA